MGLGPLEKLDEPLDDLRTAVGPLNGSELRRPDGDESRDGFLSLTPSPFQGEGRVRVDPFNRSLSLNRPLTLPSPPMGERDRDLGPDCR